jgi:hypothetical protein
MNSFTPELKRLLEKADCHFVRQGRGDHEIWESPISGIRFTVDNNIKSRHTAQRRPEAGRAAQGVLIVLRSTRPGRPSVTLKKNRSVETERQYDLRHAEE